MRPLPSLLTSRTFRTGFAVFCALFGVFQMAFAHASGHRARYLAIGGFWLLYGVFWAVAALPRRRARR